MFLYFLPESALCSAARPLCSPIPSDRWSKLPLRDSPFLFPHPSCLFLQAVFLPVLTVLPVLPHQPALVDFPHLMKLIALLLSVCCFLHSVAEPPLFRQRTDILLPDSLPEYPRLKSPELPPEGFPLLLQPPAPACPHNSNILLPQS